MEVVAQCPHCWQAVGVVIDEGGGPEQHYIEDCRVCCRPFEVHARRNADGEFVVALHRLDE